MEQKLLEKACPKCRASVGTRCVGKRGAPWDEAVHNSRRDEYQPDFAKERIRKRAKLGRHRDTHYRAYLKRKAAKQAR